MVNSMGGHGPTLLIVTWVEFAIALSLLLARVYTTLRITRRTRIDLYLTLFTFAVGTESLIALTLSIFHGLGQDAMILTEDQAAMAIKWSWVNQLSALFAIAMGKLAIVAFLQHLHGPEERWKVTILWAVAFSNLVINVIIIIIVLTQCQPLNKLWDDRLPGTCDYLRTQNCAFFQGSWSALCDLILALYPVSFFWNVQLRLPVKTGLCMLMGLGVIACICSIVKTTYLRVLSKTENVTYYLSQLITWNETEMWVILIVGCIPPIRPLLMIIFHKILTSARSATGRYNKHSRDGTELQSYTRPSKHAPKAPKPHPHGTDLLVSTVNGKGSEENILSVENGTIVKTTDISLTYEVPTGSREQGGPYRQILPHEKI